MKVNWIEEANLTISEVLCHYCKGNCTVGKTYKIVNLIYTEELNLATRAGEWNKEWGRNIDSLNIWKYFEVKKGYQFPKIMLGEHVRCNLKFINNKFENLKKKT